MKTYRLLLSPIWFALSMSQVIPGTVRAESSNHQAASATDTKPKELAATSACTTDVTPNDQVMIKEFFAKSNEIRTNIADPKAQEIQIKTLIDNYYPRISRAGHIALTAVYTRERLQQMSSALNNDPAVQAAYHEFNKAAEDHQKKRAAYKDAGFFSRWSESVSDSFDSEFLTGMSGSANKDLIEASNNSTRKMNALIAALKQSNQLDPIYKKQITDSLFRAQIAAAASDGHEADLVATEYGGYAAQARSVRNVTAAAALIIATILTGGAAMGVGGTVVTSTTATLGAKGALVAGIVTSTVAVGAVGAAGGAGYGLLQGEAGMIARSAFSDDNFMCALAKEQGEHSEQMYKDTLKFAAFGAGIGGALGGLATAGGIYALIAQGAGTGLSVFGTGASMWGATANGLAAKRLFDKAAAASEAGNEELARELLAQARKKAIDAGLAGVDGLMAGVAAIKTTQGFRSSLKNLRAKMETHAQERVKSLSQTADDIKPTGTTYVQNKQAPKIGDEAFVPVEGQPGAFQKVKVIEVSANGKKVSYQHTDNPDMIFVDQPTTKFAARTDVLPQIASQVQSNGSTYLRGGKANPKIGDEAYVSIKNAEAHLRKVKVLEVSPDGKKVTYQHLDEPQTIVRDQPLTKFATNHPDPAQLLRPEPILGKQPMLSSPRPAIDDLVANYPADMASKLRTYSNHLKRVSPEHADDFAKNMQSLEVRLKETAASSATEAEFTRRAKLLVEKETAHISHSESEAALVTRVDYKGNDSNSLPKGELTDFYIAQAQKMWAAKTAPAPVSPPAAPAANRQLATVEPATPVMPAVEPSLKPTEFFNRYPELRKNLRVEPTTRGADIKAGKANTSNTGPREDVEQALLAFEKQGGRIELTNGGSHYRVTPGQDPVIALNRRAMQEWKTRGSEITPDLVHQLDHHARINRIATQISTRNKNISINDARVMAIKSENPTLWQWAQEAAAQKTAAQTYGPRGPWSAENIHRDFLAPAEGIRLLAAQNVKPGANQVRIGEQASATMNQLLKNALGRFSPKRTGNPDDLFDSMFFHMKGDPNITAIRKTFDSEYVALLGKDSSKWTANAGIRLKQYETKVVAANQPVPEPAPAATPAPAPMQPAAPELLPVAEPSIKPTEFFNRYAELQKNLRVKPTTRGTDAKPGKANASNTGPREDVQRALAAFEKQGGRIEFTDGPSHYRVTPGQDPVIAVNRDAMAKWKAGGADVSPEVLHQLDHHARINRIATQISARNKNISLNDARVMAIKSENPTLWQWTQEAAQQKVGAQAYGTRSPWSAEGVHRDFLAPAEGMRMLAAQKAAPNLKPNVTQRIAEQESATMNGMLKNALGRFSPQRTGKPDDLFNTMFGHMKGDPNISAIRKTFDSEYAALLGKDSSKWVSNASKRLKQYQTPAAPEHNVAAASRNPAPVASPAAATATTPASMTVGASQVTVTGQPHGASHTTNTSALPGVTATVTGGAHAPGAAATANRGIFNRPVARKLTWVAAPAAGATFMLSANAPGVGVAPIPDRPVNNPGAPDATAASTPLAATNPPFSTDEGQENDHPESEPDNPAEQPGAPVPGVPNLPPYTPTQNFAPPAQPYQQQQNYEMPLQTGNPAPLTPPTPQAPEKEEGGVMSKFFGGIGSFFSGIFNFLFGWLKK